MLRAAPTARDTLLRDGVASLLRFRGREGVRDGVPVLLVPSLINRWYILDLHEGASVAEALVDAGLDTWCLDWGVPKEEDRHFDWDDVLARLARMVRTVLRRTGASSVALVGYCVGGTLSAIHAALEPAQVAALVNLAGPIDFAEGGMLRHMVDPRWFDAGAIAAAGNVTPEQMQSGFVALRPTASMAKWMRWIDQAHDRAALDRAAALEAWAADNVPFPAAAYGRYIRALYQDNELVRGEHRIAGRLVRLEQIGCPVLNVVTSRDAICPPPAAQALGDRIGSSDYELLTIPGGHVGAVVGSKASTTLYPALVAWLERRLRSSRAGQASAGKPCVTSI
jgi:polyhydroxyalkanoate synthase